MSVIGDEGPFRALLIDLEILTTTLRGMKAKRIAIDPNPKYKRIGISGIFNMFLKRFLDVAPLRLRFLCAPYRKIPRNPFCIHNLN